MESVGAVLGGISIWTRVWQKLIADNKRAHQQGLEVVYGSDLTDIEPTRVVDIVGVHGIGGHPERTWTCTSTDSHVNWLTDVLPQDLLDQYGIKARVMTYGYHAEMKSSVGFPTLLHKHSHRLARELANQRGHHLRERPVIFIAHSLGGLIVKDALVFASSSNVDEDIRLKSIQLSTIGVFYFGTPYREGQKLRWSKLLQRTIPLKDSAKAAARSSTALQQGDLFILELERYKSIEETFRNFAFYERIKSRFPGIESAMFVVPRSLMLPLSPHDWWKDYGLRCNHANLVKFTGRFDANYEAVSQALGVCVKDYNNAAANNYTLDLRLRESANRLDLEEEQGEPEDLGIALLSWHLQSFNVNTSAQEPLVMRDRIAVLERELHEVEFSKDRFSHIALQKGCDLIEVYTDTHNVEKAEPLYRRLLIMAGNEMEKLEARYGYRHRRPVRLAAELARLHSAAGQTPKAERLFNRLLVILQDLYGHYSLESAFVLNELAHVALSQGRLDTAVSLLIRVQRIQTRNYSTGEDHPETLRTIARLAMVYDHQGQYSDAQRLYRQVISRRESLRGRHHPETLKAMENLALSYRLEGKARLSFAVEQYQEVLDRRKFVLEKNRVEERWQRLERDEPSLTAISQDALHLLDETMCRLIDVTKETGNMSRAHELNKEWLAIRQDETRPSMTSASVDSKAVTSNMSQRAGYVEGVERPRPISTRSSKSSLSELESAALLLSDEHDNVTSQDTVEVTQVGTWMGENSEYTTQITIDLPEAAASSAQEFRS